MEDRFEEKLNEYICCYCADKTSDLDFAIGQLSTAIGTFEREAKRRKEKATKQLIDNFKNAYNALTKAGVIVGVEIDPKDANNNIDYSFEAEINDVNKFVFACY